MASRLQTQKDKEALKETLRHKCRTNQMRPGDRLPTLRELTSQYNLSMPTVANALQELVAEGLLHFVPRAGTFVGPGKGTSDQFFLFVPSHSLRNDAFLRLMQRAFETAVAAQGGTCLTLYPKQVADLSCQQTLANIAGVFEVQHVNSEVHVLGADSTVPRVVYRQYEPGQELSCDVFDFDQVDGGRQATRHMLSRGHRRVAFVGLHSEAGGYHWSRLRAQGWRETLAAEKLNATELEFLPPKPSRKHKEHDVVATQAISKLLPVLWREEVDAVIAVNHIVSNQLLAALRTGGLPYEKWPSLVSFDDMPEHDNQFISILQLPWDELGTQAARLLCSRASGQKNEPFVVNLIKMNLIPRLSSRVVWMQTSGIDAILFPTSSETAKSQLQGQSCVTAT